MPTELAASAVPASLAASAVALPFRPASEAELSTGASLALTSLLALALLAVAFLLSKRRGLAAPWRRAGRAGQLDVIERRALTPQTQLVVARYGTRRLLLSVGPGGTQLLRDDPSEAMAEGEP